tara:strand:- start:579 stop:752 length:174 start_codon:yes stop_codon:yes gene_type:complete
MSGDKRDRTADLLNAIQALSHLSYIPEKNIPVIAYNLFSIEYFSKKKLLFIKFRYQN